MSSAACGSVGASQAMAWRLGRGVQLQHGRGHDAQGAFGADEQVLQVETRIVLAQGGQAVPDRSVGQHDLQAQDVVARIAVAQHAGAARVGGDGAADLARTFRAQADGVQAALFRRGLLHRGQHAAGFDFHRIVGRVHAADLAQARQVDDNGRRAGLVRHRAAAQAGVAALRQYGGGVVVAQAHDVGDLPGRPRQGHAQRRAFVAAAPVFGVAGHVGVGAQDCAIAQRLDKRLEQGGTYGHVCRPVGIGKVENRSR